MRATAGVDVGPFLTRGKAHTVSNYETSSEDRVKPEVQVWYILEVITNAQLGLEGVMLVEAINLCV